MRRSLFVFFVVLFCVEPAQAGTFHPPRPAEVQPVLAMEPVLVETKDGRRYVFMAEMAVTPAQWQAGLMFRDSLSDDQAMLFVFRGEKERGFWMKNTLIPLDMLFIRADGTIHHIHENAIPHDETTVRSNGPALAVLEIKGGLSERLGLRTGDVIHHGAFGNKLVE
ncbi:MAG: DUF192 domain-containing protein [Alphaproteobacteria bacterium]|nr:DUF192 domain-containing protein [Alphaproteobacteria bacterium]